VATY